MLNSLNCSLIALGIMLATSGCEASTQGVAPAESGQVQAQGKPDEASYQQASAQGLAQARQAMSDSALTQAKLDEATVKLEELMAQANKLNTDKASLNEAELMSTLGALYARKAQFYGDNGKLAGEHLNKGFRYLDRAVTKYPENITARINRGMVSAKLPAFLNKFSVARDDLQFVIGRTEFAKLPSDLQVRLRKTLDDVQRALAQEASQQ